MVNTSGGKKCPGCLKMLDTSGGTVLNIEESHGEQKLVKIRPGPQPVLAAVKGAGPPILI